MSELIPVRKNILPAWASNRPETKLPSSGVLYIVIHETGNTRVGAGAWSQIAYLQTAEAQQRFVSYHFSVDDHEIVQGLPLDEIGYHAGDGCDNPSVDVGCFRSVAIETCVNADGDWAKTKQNLAQLVARIADGDPAFDWGSGSTRGRFDINHNLQHNQVSDEGKNCPMKIRGEGSWNDIMLMIDDEWEALNPVPTTPDYPAPGFIPPPDSRDHGVYIALNREVQVLRGGGAECYRVASRAAARTGPNFPKGSHVPIVYIVRSDVEDGARYYIHKDGHRMPVSHFVQQFNYELK